MPVIADILQSTLNDEKPTIHPRKSLPLKDVKDWKPDFSVNALGIIALLGQAEVNRTVGRLVRSWWLEYTPLLGSITFASDAFADKQPGFQLYNIDDDIYTPDVAGWLTRWLMAQGFRTASTCVEWSVNPTPINSVLDGKNSTAVVVGVGLHCVFIAWTLLTGDWWGLGNALSMTVSTVTRTYLLDRNRSWLDEAVVRAVKDALGLQHPEDGKNLDLSSQFPKSPEQALEGLPTARLIVVMSNAKAVAIRVPKCLIRTCFVLNPQPPPKTPANQTNKNAWVRSKSHAESRGEPHSFQDRFYTSVRWVAWIAFAAQIICIGQSDLAAQILTVVIIGLPTFLLVEQWGCDNTKVGRRLTAKSIDFPHPTKDEKRMDMYAFLELSDDDKTKLERWNLVPSQTSRPDWWEEYNEAAELYNKAESGKYSPLGKMKFLDQRNQAMDDRKAAREARRRGETQQSAGHVNGADDVAEALDTP